MSDSLDGVNIDSIGKGASVINEAIYLSRDVRERRFLTPCNSLASPKCNISSPGYIVEVMKQCQ